MNDKQSRLLVWLAAILIALVALTSLVEPTKKEGADDEKEWTHLLDKVEASDVKTLSITRDGVEAAFERGADGWTMTRPKAVAADSRRLDELAAALVRIEVADDLGADKLAGYGLDPAKATVTATLADGRSVTIAIGDDAPVGWQSYLKDTAGHARLTKARLSDNFGVNPLDLRSKEIIRFSQGSVTRLSLELGPQRFDVEKDDHGWWVTAAGPVVLARTRADDGRIERSLNALNDLRAESLPASPQPLDAVDRVVSVYEGPTAYVLRLGPAVEGQRAAQGPLQEGAVPVRATVLDSDLRDTVEHWLSTRLLPVRTVTVNDVTVKMGAQTLAGTRTENGWSEPKIEATLSALVAVRLSRLRAAPAPSGEAWGSVVLKEGEGRVEAIDLFQATPEGDRVAQDRAGGPPFLLSPSEIQRILDGMAGISAENPDDEAPAGMPAGFDPSSMEGLPPELMQALSNGGASPP